MHLGHGGRARLSENVPNAMILIFAMMYASARCMELFIWILYASPRNWWGRWCGDSFATQLPTVQLEDKDEAVTGPLGPQRGKDRGDAVTHFSSSKRFCGLLAFQLQCISSCSNKIDLLERFKCWLSKQDPSTLWIYAHWSPITCRMPSCLKDGCGCQLGCHLCKCVWFHLIAFEKLPSQKESSLPSIMFQRLCQTAGV